jgi:peptidoglycan hydrolase-like protein with peptidoglycan-binding domain
MRRALATLSLVLLPLFASAQTLEDLQRQIQQLLQQLVILESQTSLPIAPATSASPFPQSVASTLAPQTGPTYSCITLTRSLKFGDRGSDVAELQKYLSLNVGIYPEAEVTGYYGRATESAVKRWQSARGVVGSGDPASTGWGVVGARTRAEMANCNTVVRPGPLCGGAPSAPLVEFCKSGTWSKVYDANNCHVDWKCSGTYTPPAQCPALPEKPICPGTVTPVNDANGCILDWKCGPSNTCPVYPTPNCSLSYRLVEGELDTSGCKTASICVLRTEPVIQVTYPRAGASFVAGQTITISWDSRNAPSGAIVQFDFLTGSGALVGDGVMRGCSTSGAFSSTCTWKIPRVDDYGYCLRATDTPGICADDFPATGTYKIRARIQSGVECKGFCLARPYTVYATGESGLFTISR